MPKTRVVPADELDPKKGLRAQDYVGQTVSKAKYVALEVKCGKLKEENKRVRMQNIKLRVLLNRVSLKISRVLEEVGPLHDNLQTGEKK